MVEQIALIIIFLFVIIAFSQVIANMMKSGNTKYRALIFYGRMLLGFLLAMLIYLVFLMLKGEDIVFKLFGTK